MSYVLENIDNIKVSSNEIFNRFTLNRNLKKLLENDKALDSLKFQMDSGRIKPFIKNSSYSKNDLIWYIGDSLKSNTKELFLLRSTINDNIHEPTMKIIDNDITFEDSGWSDQFEIYTLLNNNFKGHIEGYIDNRLNIEHQYNANYHRYGNITEDELSSKVLYTDMSNIDPNRHYIHYPYKTIFLEESNVIQNGYYRIWDCGLLEYNLIFRLGYTGNKFNINGNDFDEIKCNDLILSDSQYYHEEEDSYIFYISSEAETQNNYIFINDKVETNHDLFVNSYSSTIEFPIPFIDTNYMIFTSDNRIEEHNIDLATIDQGQNSLTFTNRFTTSITPIYITYQEKDIELKYKNGLITNNFSCHIVGRWK